MKEYELSLEFWLCSMFTDRLYLPPQFLEKDTDDDAWFCRASVTDLELYRLLEGLEKFTEALKVVPGMNLLSWL